MDITIILGVSIVLQFIAVGVSLSLARSTESRKAWLAIAAAVLLMAVPRSITFMRLVRGEISRPPDLESELVALDISFLMGVGLAWIGQLFRSLRRSHRELLKSQKELIERENRLKILFENAPDAIYMMRPDGMFLDMNRAAETMTGIPRGEIVGKPVSEAVVLAESNLDWARRNLSCITSGEATGPDEYALMRRNGERGVVEVRAYPVTIGNETLVLGIGRDVTDRRRAEDEKERLEAQLRCSQRLETIGTLAGGIAHDFNNILTPILGYTGMVLTEPQVKGDARADLERVIQAALRAKELVQQILLFGRQAEQERKPILLQFIVKEVLKLLRASMPASIQIRMDIDDQCGPILADASQMHQVLMNLCTNAYHAMRERGGLMEISLQNVQVDAGGTRNHGNLGEGAYVELAVRDEGHGINAKDLERVFEPFYTTKGVGEGTGLGLAVVHGIVIQHGGEITVESEPGKGATFRVILPVVEREVAEDSHKETPIRGGNERVLFVDDETEIARMGAKMLEKLGYHVTALTSSLDALESCRANPEQFDIVITDQDMPNLSGADLIQELRLIRPELPIILMTGFSETVTSETFRRLGVSEYLMKPLTMRDLATAVRGVLDKARMLDA